jgi:hypothetical protein
MDKRRVVLLCVESLLGESPEKLLSREENVELIGPWEVGLAQDTSRGYTSHAVPARTAD